MSLYMRSHPSPCLEFQARHDLGALPVGTGSQQANPCQAVAGQNWGWRKGSWRGMQGWWDQAGSLECPWALLGDWNRPMASASSWQGHRSRVSAGLGWHSRGFRGWRAFC